MVTLNPSRPRRKPSRRNLEIYAQVKIRGCRQSAVAGEHKITQSRVSKIVAQVEAWRLESNAALDAVGSSDRRRHERWLACQRWEELYQVSVAELAASRRTLETERKGTRAGKDFQETTRREQRTNVQWMKTALKATEKLLALSELDPLPDPRPDEDTAEETRAQVKRWLVDNHMAALGLKPYLHRKQTEQLVERSLTELVGPEECAEDASAPGQDAALPAAANCHNCHTPAAETTAAGNVTSNAGAGATSIPAAGSAATADTDPGRISPPAGEKNRSDMTDSREPWEGEYEQVLRERPIRLHGVVTQ